MATAPARTIGEALGTTASGLTPRVAASLAYAAWWASGAVMLAIEPANQFVRFHAAQALAGFGALWLLGIVLWGLSFLSAFVHPAVFRGFALLGPAAWGLGIATWAWCTWQASTGRRGKLPWVGEWAERWAGREKITAPGGE